MDVLGRTLVASFQGATGIELILHGHAGFKIEPVFDGFSLFRLRYVGKRPGKPLTRRLSEFVDWPTAQVGEVAQANAVVQFNLVLEQANFVLYEDCALHRPLVVDADVDLRTVAHGDGISRLKAVIDTLAAETDDVIWADEV